MSRATQTFRHTYINTTDARCKQTITRFSNEIFIYIRAALKIKPLCTLFEISIRKLYLSGNLRILLQSSHTIAAFSIVIKVCQKFDFD